MEIHGIGQRRRARAGFRSLFSFFLIPTTVALASMLVSTPVFAAITYKQGNNGGNNSVTTVSVPYTSAQTASDLNVVVVSWTSTTSHTVTVTDTKGNAYALALSTTGTPGNGGTSQVYYAKNIVAATANANTVTVTLDSAAPFVDVRVAEYSGVDTVSPLDVTVGASSTTGTGLNSGGVATGNANDLLIGTDNVAETTSAPGAGYTQRMVTGYGNILEDKIVTSTGSYNATATQNVSAWWIMQLVAFKAASTGGDTTAPTAPTSLAATATSSTQINLTWTASTDNVGVTGYKVERCSGASCSTFAQIATPTTTSYSDTGVTASTSYSYRIRATDAAGNLSGYSTTATTSTPADTTAPTAPTNLAATVVSSTQINLSWTASTDNVSVTGYKVERCSGASCTTFAQIATPSATSYSDTALTASTAYSYRVRATDAASNLSSYSSTVSATTSAPSSITYKQGNNGGNNAVTSVTVPYSSAQAAGDLNIVVVGWTDATARTVTVTDTKGNAYALALSTVGTPNNGGTSQVYYAKNIVAATANANTVTVTLDSAAPFVDVRIAEYSGIDTVSPLDVTVGASSTSGTSLNSGSVTTGNANDLLIGTDNVAETTSAPGTGYTQRMLTGYGTVIEDKIVTSVGSYNATATQNVSGWWVMQMAAFKAASSGSDTTAPTAPTSLAATATSSTQINLTWTASTDNVGVTGYKVERCSGASCSTFAQIATPTTTSYSDTGLTVSTSYSYRIRATDAAGNLSGYSTTVSATTQAAPDTTPPSAPSSLGASAVSGTQVNLSWTASTDNVGVTNYFIERCAGTGCSTFAQVATSTTTSYSDAGLTNATAYSYRVRATDAANNLSSYSSTASATTLDTVAPTAPGNLSATAVSTMQINLAWTASTDNVGVTNYLIERCQGSGCSTFTQIGTTTSATYSDSSLTPSTAYNYRVRATDAANNLSSYSSTAGATTQTPPDTTPPSAPSNLSATATSTTRINLSWTASTDNVGVTNYLIERCQGSGCSSFSQIATTASTTYSDSSLTVATNYAYRVRATDTANNLSSYSNVANSATQYAGPITYTYTYDNLGRVTQAGGSDGSVITYTYDANGNVTSINRQ